MKKYLKALLMVLLLCGTMLPNINVKAEAVEDVTEEPNSVGTMIPFSNYEYKVLPDGTVEITKYHYSTVYKEINIVDTIDGRKVTSIGYNAFTACIGADKITIPDGVTSIGNNAFSACSTLKEIIIPNSVTSMGNDVFWGCNYVVIHCNLNSAAEAYAIANNHLYNNFSSDITLSETTYAYDGTAKTPTVTIKDGDKTLKNGTDYTLKYDNNTAIGTATVTITGKGSYVGTIIKEYTIEKAEYYNINTHGGVWNGTNYVIGGLMMTDIFFSDGTYTYYLQLDGTPMKNRLTYHPDGEHLIYLDEDGHELFDQFKYCEDVGYTCYFNTFGYLYKDEITFYNGKPYYLDGTGRMKQGEYFKFDNGVDIGYAQEDGSLINTGFGYDPWGRVVFYHWNGMIARGLITDGVWYYHMDETDGHLLGQFPVN